MKKKMQQTQPDIAPAQPPVEDADQLAVAVSATSASVEENISQNAIGESGEVASTGASLADPSETLASFREVEKQVKGMKAGVGA